MATVMPYLILNKVNDFLVFMKAVFNAEERLIVLGDDGSVRHLL